MRAEILACSLAGLAASSLRAAAPLLPWRTGLAYGGLAAPLAFVSLPLYVNLPYHYASGAGAPLGGPGAWDRGRCGGAGVGGAGVVWWRAGENGGLELEKDCWVEVPAGYRSHQIRLEGGDCSTDSFCYPSAPA